MFFCSRLLQFCLLWVCKSTLGTRNPAFGMLGILLMVNSRTSSSASVFLLLKVSCACFFGANNIWCVWCFCGSLDLDGFLWLDVCKFTFRCLEVMFPLICCCSLISQCTFHDRCGGGNINMSSAKFLFCVCYFDFEPTKHSVL